MTGPITGGVGPRGLQNLQPTGQVAPQGQVGLQGRQVDVAPPGPPRNPILRGLSNIGKAIARVFTPSAPGPSRAERAQQKAAGKLNEQLGNLIGKLGDSQRHAKVKPEQVAKHMTDKAADLWVDLYNVTRAEVGLSRAGGDPQRTVGERLQEITQALPDKDLRQLAKALRGDDVAQAQAAMTNHPDVERLLMRLEQTVTRELADRTQARITEGTNKVVDQALAALDQGSPPNRVATLMQSAFHPAKNALDELRGDRLSSLDERGVEKEVANTLQSSLSRLPADKIDALLQKTPTGELQRLAQAGPEGAIAAAVTREISARSERLLARLESGATELLAHDPAKAADDPTSPLHDPVGFAKSLNDLAESLASLREHCATHKLPFPPRGDELLAKIQGHGEELLRPGNLNLGDLSNERLGKFTKALKLLGIERANGSIQTEGERRLAPLETRYQQATRSLLDGLLHNDPAAVLRGCRDMEASFATLKNARNDIKMDLGGAPEVARLRDTLTKEVIGNLSDEEAMQLFAALQSPENKSLREGLMVAYMAADAGRDEALGLSLFGMARYLEETINQVAEDLSGPGRGIQLPRGDKFGELLLPSGDERPSLEHLTPAARQAFRDVFSIEIRGDDAVLNRGSVDREFLTSMAAIQETPPSSSEKSVVALPGGHSVGEGFYKDAMRGFDYRLPNGDALIDYANWDTLTEPEKKTRVEAGFERLIAFCDGNEDEARALSFVAHQSLAAGFRVACATNPDHNPLRLPDGRTGVVERGWPGHHEEVRTISFSRGDNGRPVVGLDYSMRGGMLQTTDGGQVWLDPQLSRMSFSYRAELRDDGGLSIQGAPTYDFSLIPSKFQRPYPPPTLQQALDPHNTTLRGDLLEFTRSQHNEEIVLAQRGIDEFRAQPTLIRALGLTEQHVRTGAPQEVNSRQTTLGPISTAVDHAMALARPAMIAAFDDAVTMVDGLIQDNYYNGKEHTLSALPGWPAGFVPPGSYHELLQSGNRQAIDAFHNHVAHPTRAPEMAAFKREMEAFSLNPSFEGAEKLFTRFITPGAQPPRGNLFDQQAPQDDTLNLDDSTRDQIRQRLDGVRNTPLAPTLFDVLNGELQTMLRVDILPRMTLAIQDGSFKP